MLYANASLLQACAPSTVSVQSVQNYQEHRMPTTINAETARAQLPHLIAQAQAGRVSVITRHGKAAAVIGPVSQLDARLSTSSLLALRGSGVGLWGETPSRTVDALRDEWGR
jgi:prevent-host-death family protein